MVQAAEQTAHPSAVRAGGRVLSSDSCTQIDEEPDFVTTVTINNNRQNPVDPWNLHANDMIQLEIQDKFRDDLGVFYERQERAFANLSDEELEEQGITQYKAIELTRLARTLLASDGDIDKLTHFREVFGAPIPLRDPKVSVKDPQSDGQRRPMRNAAIADLLEPCDRAAHL